jgi:long-subunit acyl-CoA synthetase (AMP-forming)
MMNQFDNDNEGDINAEIRGAAPVDIGDLTVPRWLAERRSAKGPSAVVSVHADDQDDQDEQNQQNQWHQVTWDQFDDQIRALAAGLIADGVQRGVVDREFSEDHDELTPTLELRREQILDHFSQDVEALYDEQRHR